MSSDDEGPFGSHAFPTRWNLRRLEWPSEFRKCSYRRTRSRGPVFPLCNWPHGYDLGICGLLWVLIVVSM